MHQIKQIGQKMTFYSQVVICLMIIYSCSSPLTTSGDYVSVKGTGSYDPSVNILESDKKEKDQPSQNIGNFSTRKSDPLSVNQQQQPEMKLDKKIQDLKLTGHSNQRIKKISNSYYENVLKDLFNIELSLYLDLTRDTKLDGFEAIAQTQNKITPLALEKYFDIKEKVSTLIIKLGSYKKYTNCQCTDTYQPECLTEFLEKVTPLMIKSDVSSDEILNIVTLSEKIAGPKEQSFCEYLKPGLEILLFSPGFIYFQNSFSSSVGTLPVKQAGNSQNPQIQAYSGHALAHKLSAFIWNAPPTDKILTALKNPTNLSDKDFNLIVTEMLNDNKVKGGMLKFFVEYLSLDQLYNPGILAKESAKTSTRLRSLYLEIEYFLNHHFSYQNSSIKDLLTSQTTFLNKDLNEIYKTNQKASEFTKVDLDDTLQRRGIFGKAGIMQLLSHGEETSPTLRGKTISDLFLCRALPQPDGDADTSFPERKPGQSKRDLIREHLENPSCASCHTLMDPLGLPFEVFDSKGVFRSVDEFNQPIDSSGEFNGKQYQTPNELQSILAESENFTLCFASKMVEFATGENSEELKKSGLIDSMHQIWASKNFKIKDLMLLIVTSSFFRTGKKS